MPDPTDVIAGAMARALALAERGLYTTSPNPRVGCVIVRDGAILGEGYHERAGGPHAEVRALDDAREQGRDVRGATMVVTLEPCNHVGRTGACTDAIIESGIGRVVAAMRDPNPQARDGASRLRAAGIETEFGEGEREARELNPGFLSVMTRGRPWVRVKSAASLDGRTALDNGASQWITGAAARADGHHFRARSCGILTGIGTVQADDPELTVRAVATPRQPRRIVVDRHAHTPASARVMRGGGTLVVTAGPRAADWPADVASIALPDADGRVDLPAMMRELAAREIAELQVEAGARLVGALFADGLVDELLLYLAPSLLGDPARGVVQHAQALARLDERIALVLHSVDRIGDDLRVIARIAPRSA